MQFDNDFTVDAPVDEVYAALLDLERVTPAMPGASVLEKVDDDNYKVAIKVKLGPVTMTYRGDVTVVEKDPAAHSAVLDVKAKEARGQGSANAKVTMALSSSGSGTSGTMKSEVQLSGKAAAMSRGVIDDVSKRLVTTFAENLEEILGAGGSTASSEGDGEEKAAADAPAGDEAPTMSGGEAAAGSNGGGAGAAGGEASAPPKPSPPSPDKPRAAPPPRSESDDVLDVGSLAGGMAADRLKNPKVLGALIGVVLLVAYLLGRRS